MAKQTNTQENEQNTTPEVPTTPTREVSVPVGKQKQVFEYHVVSALIAKDDDVAKFKESCESFLNEGAVEIGGISVSQSSSQYSVQVLYSQAFKKVKTVLA